MLQSIKDFAIMSHENVNHKYGDYPYSFHLMMVVEVAHQFTDLIPLEDRDNFLAACWMHDTIEDCRLTYNDVLKVSNLEVANIVYALSNEKGKNRKQRANRKYYKGIIETKYARLVKLCDRIANIRFSKTQKSIMLEVYKNENDHFIYSLFPDDVKVTIYEIRAIGYLISELNS